MRPHDLVVRCFAERLDNQQWQAICLDFDLAAQGDSLPEVRRKLESMIEHYVREAMIGEDREFGAQLLSRSVPWWTAIHLRYWGYCALIAVFGLFKRSESLTLYETPIPLAPQPSA